MHLHTPADADAALPDIAFIGGGNMARSLVGGLLAGGRAPGSIHVAEPFAAARAGFATDFGVDAVTDNLDAAARAGVWVIAVKPQVLPEVARSLAELAQRTRPLVISIAAGITSGQLEGWLGGSLPVVRAMPNTPAMLGAGATGLFANDAVSPAQRRLAEQLLGSTGVTAWVECEAQMDAVTALSGSGPAYIFLLAEAMQAAGEAQGLPADAARVLALQTIHGAARMLLESGESAADLRLRVTSPDGTTQAAIETFESGGLRRLVGEAIAAATRRSRELSAAHGPLSS